MERQAKGIWIPIEIWENKELSWNEKILFLEIDSFTTKDKDCYISNEYIAKLLGITENSANRVLSSLISKGYVIKTAFDGRKRYVKTAFSYSKADYTQENKQGIHERIRRDNTDEYIPNTSNNTSNKEISTNVDIKKDKTSSCQSEYQRFDNWVKNNAPYCYKNMKAITEAEYEKMNKTYKPKQICFIIEQIENRKDLRKRYTNLYRTVLNWAKKEYGDKGTTKA